MSSPESAIIEMDVGLEAKSKGEIDDYLLKTEIIKDNLEEIRKASGGEISEDTVIPTGSQKRRSKKEEAEEKTELTEFLEQLTDKDINKLAGFLKSPQSFIESGLKNLLTTLGPNAAVIIPLVAAITAAPILYIEILKALSVKGGPFNRDWRRAIQNEIDAGLTREQAKRTELGLDQVILVQSRGFVANNPIATYNSLYLVNESRIARVGLDDRAAGVSVG